MKLTLIRHTSLAIEPGICYGQSDITVSDQFTQEATIVKQKIQDLHFDAIYTSPLSRCVTLANFCNYPNAIQDDRLMELNFGDWEQQKWTDIQDPLLTTWYNDWLNTPTPNGESFMMQYQRYVSFIQSLHMMNHQSIAIFTHGGIIHCARILQGIDRFDNTFDNKPDYGAVLTLELQ